MNTIKIQYELHSSLIINDTNYDLETALKLLKAIQDENNLQTAIRTVKPGIYLI